MARVDVKLKDAHQDTNVWMENANRLCFLQPFQEAVALAQQVSSVHLENVYQTKDTVTHQMIVMLRRFVLRKNVLTDALWSDAGAATFVSEETVSPTRNSADKTMIVLRVWNVIPRGNVSTNVPMLYALQHQDASMVNVFQSAKILNAVQVTNVPTVVVVQLLDTALRRSNVGQQKSVFWTDVLTSVQLLTARQEQFVEETSVWLWANVQLIPTAVLEEYADRESVSIPVPK